MIVGIIGVVINVAVVAMIVVFIAIDVIGSETDNVVIIADLVSAVVGVVC